MSTCLTQGKDAFRTGGTTPSRSMRNHFHLALEAPEPNLSDGMKWLHGTWAQRFNRFRQETAGRPKAGAKLGTANPAVCSRR